MHTSDHTPFNPPLLLRNASLQTVLSSLRLRTLGRNPMLEASQEMIFSVGDGVRLQGFYSPQKGTEPKGLAILLHGWEGSAESTYIIHTGRFLYFHGYEVFRLNLRDHGRTHHLNEGLFYGTLLDEVAEATAKAAALCRKGPVLLMGFSLGGNFALRVAGRLGKQADTPLCHAFAVSPALDPGKATDSIDSHPLLRRYFLAKWKRSLIRKQELYPELYDFSRMLSGATVRQLTDALIEQSGRYASSDEYFAGYTLKNDFFQGITVPLTIVVSEDDPAIPTDDFRSLRLAPHHRLIIHTYGGHNGFLYGMFAPAWYEREAIRILPAGSR